MTDQVNEHVEAPESDASLQAQTESQEAVEAGETSTQQEPTVQSLQAELAAAQQEAAENQDRYLRARADMENYKKRIERTYADRAKWSQKDLLKKLLGVKDNLERALSYGEAGNTSGEGILEGVRLTMYQLDQLLSQEGVRPIEAHGQPFDPRLEEAVQSVDDPNVPDHTVVQVVRTGYTYQDDDEVLRPAQVIVSVHGSDG